MGLKSVFSNAAQTAFAAAGDVPASARFEMVGSSVYDASSGVTSALSSSIMTTMLFSNFSRAQIDNENVLPTDVRALLPQAYISGIVPATDNRVHKVEAGASTEYTVIEYGQDPAGATWWLQLRKP